MAPAADASALPRPPTPARRGVRRLNATLCSRTLLWHIADVQQNLYRIVLQRHGRRNVRGVAVVPRTMPRRGDAWTRYALAPLSCALALALLRLRSNAAGR